jgi:hypothetical protein
MSTWEYFKKEDVNATNHENTFIDPIRTKEFDFKFHK